MQGGPTWLYVPRVIEMVEWSKRSWTTSRMDASFEGERGPRVAEAVERHAGEVVLRHATEEHGAHGIGLQGRPTGSPGSAVLADVLGQWAATTGVHLPICREAI